VPSGSTAQPASLQRALRTSLLSQCFGSLKLPYIRSPEKIFAAMALLLLSLLLLFSLSFHVGSLVPEVIPLVSNKMAASVGSDQWLFLG